MGTLLELRDDVAAASIEEDCAEVFYDADPNRQTNQRLEAARSARRQAVVTYLAADRRVRFGQSGCANGSNLASPPPSVS